MAEEVQTVLVRKIPGRTKADADRIAAKVTGKKPRTSRETPEHWRYRQFPPERCRDGTHATFNVPSHGRGVQVVVCALKQGASKS